jgi:hypothetical protein
MKRIRILGLCLVVACAFGAVSAVSSASAAEQGQCVAAKHAKWNNSTCTEAPAKAGKGHFEFEAADSCYAMKHGNFTEGACKTVAEKHGVPDHKGHFELAPSPAYTSESTNDELITPGFGAVKCAHEHGTGVVTGGTSSVTGSLFTECESSGQPCGNVGPGEIQTFSLTGALTEPSTGTAETVLTPTSGKYLAEFACVGVAFIRTGGHVGGKNTPVNTSGTTTTFAFEKGVEQGLETEFSASEKFEPAETVGPFASEQVGVFTLVGSPAEETKVE